MKCVLFIIQLTIVVCLADVKNYDDDPRFTKAITLSPPPASYQNNQQQYVNQNTYKQINNNNSNSFTNYNGFVPSQPLTQLSPLSEQNQQQKYQNELQHNKQHNNKHNTIHTSSTKESFNSHASTITSQSQQQPTKTYKTYKIIIEKHKPNSYQKPIKKVQPNIHNQQKYHQVQQRQAINYVLPPHHVNLPKIHTQPMKSVGANFLGSFSEGELVQIIQAISPENFNLLKISKANNQKPIIQQIPPVFPVYSKYYNPYTHGKYIQVIPHDHSTAQVQHHQQHQPQNTNNFRAYQRTNSYPNSQHSIQHKRETFLSEGIPVNVLSQLPPRFMIVGRRAY